MGSVAGWVALDFLRFIHQPISAPIPVTIGKGWSLTQIARTLEQKEAVTSSRWFSLLARVEKIRKNRLIQAGEYVLAPHDTPSVILTRMTTGQVVTHRLVVPEGWTVLDVGKQMKAQGWDKVDALLADPTITQKLALNAPSLEGWLFPSTYHYQRGDSTLGMLARMVKQAQYVLNEQWKIHAKNDAQNTQNLSARSPRLRSSRDRLSRDPLSRFEMLILASIIEKETGQAEERKHISAVFHNRLRKRMRLQSDPTVIYGLLHTANKPHYDGNLTKKHLRTPTPYNTYTQFGLPPTPICNPGRAAIEAAISPDTTKDFFFVARGEGFHAFSRTLKEHTANVNRYQRRRSSQKKPAKTP